MNAVNRGIPKFWEVGVAVSGTAYSFDRLFSYLSIRQIPCGCRVVVPFGNGNAHRLGLVLSCKEHIQSEIQLKNVLEIVDETPVLSGEMQKLVFWLRQTTFCTYYDAVRTVLPPHLQIHLEKEITLTDSPGEAPLTKEEENLYFFLSRAKLKKEFRKLLRQNPQPLVQSLLAKGYLKEQTRLKAHTKGRAGRACVRLIPNPQTAKSQTPKQRRVLQVLQELGSLSEREVCLYADVSSATIGALVRAGFVERYYQKPPLHPYAKIQKTLDVKDLRLTAEQQRAYDAVAEHLDKPRCFLLHGVTGSGKTSVYLHLIDTVVKAGRQVILLVPEIALTPQIVSRFCEYFGDIVAVIHSELSLGQRGETWRRVHDGKIRIVIGTRSAIFAPTENLGLVVVDEEEERTYKSDSAPRYHAVDVAKERCKAHGCPLLLASATPSIESYYYASRGVYTLLQMKERYNKAPLPEVEVVDMQEERACGTEGMFSDTLRQALRENLQNGMQSLLLLNRRGYHTIIQCACCASPVYCPNCSIPMTYHKIDDSLLCHYCGHSQKMVSACPKCGSTHMRKMGFGTERVQEQLQEIVPGARILRMDADTTMSRSAYEAGFSAFRRGDYDILLGTQMIGRGLDFPRVTLVGVLSVDKALFAGDFRSYERTFSLITQVVGRGGRGNAKGRAILQTFMPDHYVLRLAAQQAYEAFYEQEIAVRRQLVFPPICDICVLYFVGLREQDAKEAAEAAVELFKEKIEELKFSYPLRVLRPVRCLCRRLNRRYRYQLVVKCKNTKPYRELLSGVLAAAGRDARFSKVRVFADRNGDIA